MKPDEIKAALPYLTHEERGELNTLLAADFASVAWRPLPGPQTMAYESEADIIGYGGAAGGGKTDLIIGFALTKHRRSFVVRKNGTEHSAFVDRMTEVLGSRDGLNAQQGIWRIEQQVANTLVHRQVELGSVPNPGDEAKYRGRPHDFKSFDEVTEIPVQQVRFLLAWLRTTVEGQRCRALLTFNPPSTAEGRWVIEYFAPWLDPNHINPALPGELRWFVTIKGKDVEVVDGTPFTHEGELLRPQSRTFIPSRVTDNPFLANTGYMTVLQSLPEPLRSQMLYGDFNAGVVDNAWQVIPTAWVDQAMQRWKKREPKPMMESLGVDVARGGLDNTIISRRHGNWFDEMLTYPGTQTPDGPTVAGLTIAAQRDRCPIHIDVVGVGSSPYDFLNAIAGIQVIGVNASEKSLTTDQSGRLKFANQRSEMWWKLRELLDPANNNAVELPPDPQLKRELCAPTWKLQGAVIQVQSREEIIDTVGVSPDRATAVALANFRTPRIEDVNRSHGASNSRVYDAVGTLAEQHRARPSDRRAYDPMAKIR